MLVQAKLLDLNDIEYPEIKRTIGKLKPPVRQIDRLIESAEKLGFPPLYAFYNHLTIPDRVPATCRSLEMCGISPMPESWGVAVADAYRVRSVLDDQSFDTHRQHSIALHCLLCSSGLGSRLDLGSPGLALTAPDSHHTRFPSTIGERPIMFRLAHYMIACGAEAEARLTVDCDYNRHKHNPKTFLPAKAETIDADGHEQLVQPKRFFPDIVVHECGVDDQNILVCEIKRTVDPRHPDIDCSRLEELTRTNGNFGYQVGAFVEIDQRRCAITVKYFENGMDVGEHFIDLSAARARPA
jgi:hypothetical protein